MALASIHDLNIHQMDVMITLLNVNLDEEKFNYFDCTPVSTPMDTSEKLKPNNGKVVSHLECLRFWKDTLMQVGSATLKKIRQQVLSGKEVEWLKNLILKILLLPNFVAPISIRCDSETTLAKAYSLMYNGKSRYLSGCDATLETLHVDMEARENACLMKKAYTTLILCLGDRILREVTKETAVAGILDEVNYPGTKLGDQIDEFNKLIFDLTNIDIEIEDEDQALMFLTSLPSSYENFMETSLYGRESLTMEDVLATQNSRE
ncbi:hypothetical protein Tco_0780231 [Tanacetum coccineum]